MHWQNLNWYTGTGWGLRRIWAPGMWSRPQTLLNVYLRASHLIGHYNVSDMCLKWPSWGFDTCKHVSEHQSFKRSKASKLFQSFKVIQALPSAGADHLRRFWAEPAGRSNFGAVSWQLDMMPSQCLGCDLKWCSTFLSRIQFACSDYHSDFFWFAASAPSDVLRLTTSNRHGWWVCCVCKNLLLCVLAPVTKKTINRLFWWKVVENHDFLYHRMCVKVSHSPPWRPKKNLEDPVMFRCFQPGTRKLWLRWPTVRTLSGLIHGTTWWPVATADPIGTISGPQIMKYPKLMQAMTFRASRAQIGNVFGISDISPNHFKKRNRNMG